MTYELHIKTDEGSPVLLRPLLPEDKPALADAIARFSNRSRYMRFFSGMTTIPDPVLDRLADVDGMRHIAWVAIDEATPGRPVIGAAHAMRATAHNESADFAIGLVDKWQHKGVARLLVALLVAESQIKGVEDMTADVLWENRKGKSLMKALDAASTGTDANVIHFQFSVDGALNRLREDMSGAAMETVFAAIETGGPVPAAA
ncbi:GNAT family N-acetyltransferase [Henriciella sp.]|uniref:GNAT family N-acetyltransferase n=1 Tax=Henriciella sp. TaxID=1968823 RepID=UPI00260EAA34|nr:GNAT family N-acetyltransferase [Henriciella sp.]